MRRKRAPHDRVGRAGFSRGTIIMEVTVEKTQASSVRSLTIPLERVGLQGDLVVPRNAQGIVLFAHGSGSGRKSSRNRFVAQVLQEAGLATLLFDLLTLEEEEAERFTAHLRFDI